MVLFCRLSSSSPLGGPLPYYGQRSVEAEGPSRKEGDGKIMKNEGKWGKRDRSTFFFLGGGRKGDSLEMMALDPVLSLLLLLKKGAAASGGRSLTKEPLMV